MAEDRRATGQRIENLNLYGCIGDVILAPKRTIGVEDISSS